jgi:hypothetical protein
MPLPPQKNRLLRAFAHLANQAQGKDLKLLKEIEKCPSSKAACAVLAGALNASRHSGGRDEFLNADASWIHPLI